MISFSNSNTLRSIVSTRDLRHNQTSSRPPRITKELKSVGRNRRAEGAIFKPETGIDCSCLIRWNFVLRCLIACDQVRPLTEHGFDQVYELSSSSPSPIFLSSLQLRHALLLLSTDSSILQRTRTSTEHTCDTIDNSRGL